MDNQPFSFKLPPEIIAKWRKIRKKVQHSVFYLLVAFQTRFCCWIIWKSWVNQQVSITGLSVAKDSAAVNFSLIMGLLPLEFTDCLQDSPYFRDSLHSHEKELERTSSSIKELVKEVKNLLQAAKSKSTMSIFTKPYIRPWPQANDFTRKSLISIYLDLNFLLVFFRSNLIILSNSSLKFQSVYDLNRNSRAQSDLWSNLALAKWVIALTARHISRWNCAIFVKDIFSYKQFSNFIVIVKNSSVATFVIKIDFSPLSDEWKYVMRRFLNLIILQICQMLKEDCPKL